MTLFATLSIRVPMQIAEKIEDDINTGMFSNKSSAVNSYLKVGIRISEYQIMLKDPEKAKEFQKKMHDIVQNENLEGWLESLSVQQLEGFLGLLQIEKEKRFEQRSLV